MNNLNYIFFEEFKHLDKLCGELYRDQYGVSHYIDDMKDVPQSDYQYIPNWKEDLKHLIRLRHIRNYLAHTEGSFNEELCTQKDIKWSQDFYKRILHQSDPLAMLYQHAKTKQAVRQVKTPPSSAKYNTGGKRLCRTNTKKSSGIKRFCFIVLLLVIVGILLFVVFALLYHIPDLTLL